MQVLFSTPRLAPVALESHKRNRTVDCAPARDRAFDGPRGGVQATVFVLLCTLTLGACAHASVFQHAPTDATKKVVDVGLGERGSAWAAFALTDGGVIAIGMSLSVDAIDDAEPAPLAKLYDARGTLQWERALDVPERVDLAVASERYIALAGGDTLALVRRRDGAPVWERSGFRGRPAFLAMDGNDIVAAWGGGDVVRYTTRGALTWLRRDEELRPRGVAQDRRGAILIAEEPDEERRRLAAYDLRRHGEDALWQRPLSGDTITVHGPLVVASVGSPVARARDARSGERRGEADTSADPSALWIDENQVRLSVERGALLRLQRLDAWSLDDAETPAWTAYLIRGGQEPTPYGFEEGLLVESAGRVTFVDLAGEVRWTHDAEPGACRWVDAAPERAVALCTIDDERVLRFVR